jgi:hypothetical protein
MFDCGFSVGALHESGNALNCHPFAGLNSMLHQLLHESRDPLNCRFSCSLFHCDFHNETMKHRSSCSTAAIRQLACFMGLAMLSTVAGRQLNWRIGSFVLLHPRSVLKIVCKVVIVSETLPLTQCFVLLPQWPSVLDVVGKAIELPSGFIPLPLDAPMHWSSMNFSLA